MKSAFFSSISLGLTFALVVAISFPGGCRASIDFCLRGRHKLFAEPDPPPSLELDKFSSYEDATLQQQQQEQSESRIVGCPSGILFSKPYKLEAVTSDEEPFCYKESICDENWQCSIQKKSITAEVIKIGKPGRNESWLYSEGDRDMKSIMDFDQCQPSDRLLLPSNNEASNRAKREITGLVPSEPASAEQIQREVDDQTKRMFYYLSGINQDQVNSHLRVVKLFKMSTQLVSIICDPHYIRPRFLQEIERGFLFLLKEQGFDKMTDLDLESYNQLKQSLEHCASTVKMIKFMGRPCPTGIKVSKVYQVDGDEVKAIEYHRSPKTFKWGEYDVVLDGAWSTMSIVYAGCFNSFSGKVNLLHKFEVALEQIFHSALYVRWEHPTQLADDLFYDSVFMARVNDTLEVMDACNSLLHLLTPLQTQLNRPIHETFYRRKKRSVPDESSSSEESFHRMFSSMENSVGTSKGPATAPLSKQHEADASQEENGYEQDHFPSVQCFTTEEERLRTLKMVQEKKYNGCK